MLLLRSFQLWLLFILIHGTEEEENVFDFTTYSNESDAKSGFSCDLKLKVEVPCRCTSPAINIPKNLPANITSLTIEDSDMEVLHNNALQPYASTLKELTLENLHNFVHIETGAFDNLIDLHTIFLHRLPKLEKIAPELFKVVLPKLKILKIQETGLTEVPNFNGLITGSVLHLIDLEHNKIQRIARRQISRIKVEQLLLKFNELEALEEEAFYGSEIATLSLRGNIRLTQLHPRAFSGLESLRYIDLSSTSITNLPTDGLRGVEVLKVQETETLKIFPSIYNFQYIREAWLTYPYHCCAFKFPHTHNPSEYARHAKFLQQLQEACQHKNSTLKYIISDHTYPQLRTLLQWLPLNATFVDPNYDDASSSDVGIFHNSTVPNQSTVTAVCGNISKNYHEVVCHPAPDAFNPCEDIMGNWALRIPVWFISLSAIIGNLFVVIVILTSHFRLTVSKFLMCNLAAADLSIGLHLFLIAVVDACSIGSYFNYAIDWQEGDGCRVAGFLTIFGNVLSVYTLAVITTERWYTITWAIHLNRRLKLSTAIRVMAAGWGLAIFLASMPLVGVSNYSKTSICLPLENKNRADMIYLGTLLAFNALAFVLICICYGSMYRSIREGGNKCSKISSVRSDMTVAKRMALLVFTDFACWAPIAFFGLTALLGYPLITVTNTKILLVFFYPLNSCANPYLYALLTQQYRRDFFLLMGKYGLCKDRAERHRGAIGGVPLPYGSGPQYKRPCSESRLKRGTGNNSNRSSMMTMVSVEMPVVRSYSKYNAKHDPFGTLPEKVLNKPNSNHFDDELNNLTRNNVSENL